MRKHVQNGHFTIKKHEKNKGFACELSADGSKLSGVGVNSCEVGLHSREVVLDSEIGRMSMLWVRATQPNLNVFGSWTPE